MKNNSPDTTVSIIIVNWNTNELLRNCLESLRKVDRYEEIQTIVVDNKSKDGSRSMVSKSFPEVLLINAGGNIGFGKANNLAIPHISSPFVLYLNPDTVVFKDLIAKMVDFMDRNETVGALGSKMIWPDGQIQPLGIQWFPSPITEFVSAFLISKKSLPYLKKYIPYRNPRKNGYVKKLYGGCLMVRKQILDSIGYFDERFFMYGEDVDLCRRIYGSGWKLYYLTEAKIIHYCGGSSEGSNSQFSILMKCESICKYMHKYYGKFGENIYRLITFSGAFTRMLLLYNLKAIYYVLKYDSAKIDSSREKQESIFKWSIGLAKPRIIE